jgi:hypothetical protein
MDKKPVDKANGMVKEKRRFSSALYLYSNIQYAITSEAQTRPVYTILDGSVDTR